MVSDLVLLKVDFVRNSSYHCHTCTLFSFLGNVVDDRRNSFSERLEAKLTDIQEGTNHERSPSERVSVTIRKLRGEIYNFLYF